MRVYKLSGGWMERWRRRKRIESREWRFSFFFSFCLLTSTSPIISLVETVVSIRRMLPWWMSTSNLTHWNRLKRNTIGIGAMPAKMMTTAIANTQPGYAVGTAMPWKQRKGKKKERKKCRGRDVGILATRYMGHEIIFSATHPWRIPRGILRLFHNHGDYTGDKDADHDYGSEKSPGELPICPWSVPRHLLYIFRESEKEKDLVSIRFVYLNESEIVFRSYFSWP